MNSWKENHFLSNRTKELTAENPNWIEGVKEFIDYAQKCAKIARAKNNCHDLSIMAKKVGSNFFLLNRRLSANLNYAFAALSAEAVAASAAPTTSSISKMVSPDRLELSTDSLKGKRSTIELRAQ